MPISLAIDIFLRGVVVPAGIAAAVLWLIGRACRGETWHRYAVPLAFAVGYCAAYVLQPKWAPLVPERSWHWTLYLAPAAALVGSIAVSSGLTLLERWLLQGLTALVAAWLLVPDWANLQPARTVCVPLLTAYVWMLTALLVPLARRIPNSILLATLCAASLAVAMTIAAFASVTLARGAACAAGALTGCLLGALFSPGARTHGLGLAYAVVVGGWAFTGGVDPNPPLWGFLAIPVIPLALWGWAVFRKESIQSASPPRS